AEQIAGEDISERIEHFANVEAELITSDDSEFRFHSGAPNWLRSIKKQQYR
ncbi:hypothetical protein CIK04_25200, partial [Vibrio sp. 03_296]|uniref:tRNA isopentenyl-2-thiomethyl-A-37 hydroxylase MiaE n=1 Tax=Vibrio sp. 03_296 TaxID=2024409 RepID=UPI000BDAEB3D